MFFVCMKVSEINQSVYLLARFQAKLVLGQAAANVKIRGRILFAVRGCETILFCT